jgi:hypothetical protein
LQYVREAPVWANPKDRPALALLREYATSEYAATEALAVWLQKLVPGLPPIGAFPSHFLNYNDVAFRHVLPFVQREHALNLTHLADDATALGLEVPTPLAALLTIKNHNAAAIAQLDSTG